MFVMILTDYYLSVGKEKKKSSYQQAKTPRWSRESTRQSILWILIMSTIELAELQLQRTTPDTTAAGSTWKPAEDREWFKSGES